MMAASKPTESTSPRPQPRWWRLGLVVAVVAYILAIEFVPTDPGERVEAALPEKGIGFFSRELPLDEATQEALGDSLRLRREYDCRGQRIIITILDGRTNRHAVHDPIYCLRGSGWEVNERSALEIPGGEAEQLVISKDGMRSAVLFWFSTPSLKHASLPRYRWQAMLRRLTFGRSGPEPVLVLLQGSTDRPVEWERFFAEFPYLSDL